MHRHDRGGPRPDQRRHRVGIDREVLADVRETHRCPAAQDRVDGRGEGEGRGDHLLAGTDVEHCERGVERDRSIRNCNGVRGAGHLGAERFEATDHGSLRQMTAAQHLEDQVFHLGAELRCRDPDPCLNRGLDGGHDDATSRAPPIRRRSAAMRRRSVRSPVAMATELRIGETVERPDAA